MKSMIRRLMRFSLGPAISYFGPRFENVNSRLSDLDTELKSTLQQIRDQLADMSLRLDDFQREISTDVQTGVEVLLTHQRATAAIQEQVAELRDLILTETKSHDLQAKQPPTQSSPTTQPN